MNARLLLLATMLAMPGAPLVAGQQDKSAPATGTAADAVNRVDTAYRVAEWARAAGDAQAMLTAATILESADLVTRPADGTIERLQNAPDADRRVMQRAAPAKPAAPAAIASPRPGRTVGALLDEAEALSNGDPAILAAVAARRRQGMKGVASSSHGQGPIGLSREIPAQSAWRVSLTVRGGALLNVIAIGDGDTDVDLEIRDATGRIVCDDRSPGYHASCSLTPPFAGDYTARIVNRGMIRTVATLVSN